MKQLAGWGTYIRGAALLVLAAGFMTVSAKAREDADCTKCTEDGGVYKCQKVGKGEEGFNGVCTENKDGCSWGLGEKCDLNGPIPN